MIARNETVHADVSVFPELVMTSCFPLKKCGITPVRLTKALMCAENTLDTRDHNHLHVFRGHRLNDKHAIDRGGKANDGTRLVLSISTTAPPFTSTLDRDVWK